MDYFIHYDHVRDEYYLFPLINTTVSYNMYTTGEISGSFDPQLLKIIKNIKLDNIDYEDLVKILGEER